jgi:hypothetical protein
MKSCSNILVRRPRLSEHLRAIGSGNPLTRLYVVARNFYPGIAKSALDEPAAPLTLGALAAAGFAAFWGWAATHFIAWPFRHRSRLRAMRGSVQPGRSPVSPEIARLSQKSAVCELDCGGIGRDRRGFARLNKLDPNVALPLNPW